MAYFPLQVSGEVLGLLVLEAAAQDGLTADELYLAEVMAHQMAGAISLSRYHQQLADAATRDSLTGLYNRGYFFSQLEAELESRTLTGAPVSLIMLDMIGFKELNDQYGHVAGDRALQEWAHWLKGYLTPHAVAARYGGDEFVVVLPEADQETALRIAAAVAATEGKTVQVQGARVPFPTLSYGVATSPEDGLTASQLVAAVDASLYKHKRECRLHGYAQSARLQA